MLPQQHVAARRHHIEIRAERPVEHQEHQRGRDDRERRDDDELRHECHPGEHRHTHQPHAGSAQVHDSDDEVDSGCDGRDAQHLEANGPEIHVQPGRELRAGQVGVAEPTRIGRRPYQEAHVHEQAAEQEHPVAEGVEPREGHVPGTDLQRHDEVEECCRERHDGQEHHGRAVHREQFVERLGAHNRVVRGRELKAHDERLEATDKEEGERGDAVQNPDPLVVGGGDPAPDPGAEPHRIGGCRTCHSRYPS